LQDPWRGLPRALLEPKMAPPVSSLALSLPSKIVIAWVVVSLVVAVAFGAVAARLGDQRRVAERRSGPSDRRSGIADRRIGLPDARDNPVERRRSTRDRRAGPGDRRALGRRGLSVA
jgi:hypothetical protein